MQRAKMTRVATTRKIVIVFGTAIAVGMLFAGWQSVRAWMAWNDIERVAFDLGSARGALPWPAPVSEDDSGPDPTVTTVEYDTVLVIGSDRRPDGTGDREGREYADAVMFYMMPDDGSRPLIVSLPRDLIVTNPCTGEATKLDRTLRGCGDEIGGEELVALVVEDFTGVGVDTFASFEFEAVVTMIDSVGGVEVCVPNALRDGSVDLLPEGCSRVDGVSALAWIRSRETQESVSGEWRFVDVVGDAARVPRQQTLVLALLDSLKRLRAPGDLASLAEGLKDTFVLDESLDLVDAVAMAWVLRSVTGPSIRMLVVPTTPATLDDGSYAVRATVPFAQLIRG